MNTEDLVINEGSQAQVIKHLRAHLPYIVAAVLLDTLIIEAVHLCDLPGLVVAPDQSHPYRVPHLGNNNKQKFEFAYDWPHMSVGYR